MMKACDVNVHMQDMRFGIQKRSQGERAPWRMPGVLVNHGAHCTTKFTTKPLKIGELQFLVCMRKALPLLWTTQAQIMC